MIIKKTIKRIQHLCFAAVLAVAVVACGATNPPTISQGHIKSESDKLADKDSIPLPVTQVPVLPRPGKRKKLETYTVVVNQVPIREIRHVRKRGGEQINDKCDREHNHGDHRAKEISEVLHTDLLG